MANRAPRHLNTDIPEQRRLGFAFKVLELYLPEGQQLMPTILFAEEAATDSAFAELQRQGINAFTRPYMISTAMVYARLSEGTFPDDTLSILDVKLAPQLKKVGAKSIKELAATLVHSDNLPAELQQDYQGGGDVENPKQAASQPAA